MDIVWRREARRQFLQIVKNVEETFGKGTAMKVRDELASVIAKLSHSPHMGHPDYRFTLKDDVRLYSTRLNHIFYSIEDNKTILILGIFDARKSPTQIAHEVTINTNL